MRIVVALALAASLLFVACSPKEDQGKADVSAEVQSASDAVDAAGDVTETDAAQAAGDATPTAG